MSLFTRGTRVRVKMPFSVEDKHAIKVLSQTKHHGVKDSISMFPNKQWSLGGLKNIKDFDEVRNCISEECDKLSRS